jgi:very-short-patch-repair endonuclease/RecA/RadA recombinase
VAQSPWLASSHSRALMAKAADAWRRGLVDVSGSNKRLYYAPLRVGTLVLGDAKPAALSRLLAGDPVKLTELFPDDGTEDGLAAQAKARKASDLLAAKGKLGEEETGDSPVRLALGLATWVQETGVVSQAAGSRKERAPRSPLLLAPVHFTLVPGTRTVSSLQLTGEPELNSALKFVLDANHGVDLDAEGWLSDAVSPDGTLNSDRLLKVAGRLGGKVTGWEVSTHTVVDAFGSDRELMLRDLEDEELLAGSIAQSLMRSTPLPDDGSDKAAPDSAPVTLEHLVLDADASQQAVIGHALAGRSLTVAGPPGCGKSQVITNLIAEAAAAGKTVLFVAQKRAAVDAVMNRLSAVGLDDAVLEVFDTKTKRGNVIAQLRESLEQLSTTARRDTTALHRDLQASRDRLVAHDRALHVPRESLGGQSAYDLIGRIAAIPALPQTSQRLPFSVVGSWQGELVERLATYAGELAILGGLDPNRAARPGWSVDTVTTEAVSAVGYDAAATISSSWLTAQQTLTRVLAGVGLSAPSTTSEAQAGLELLVHAAGALTVFVPQMLDAELLDDVTLARMIVAVGPKADRRAARTTVGKVGYFARRALRKQLRPLVLPGAPGTDDKGRPDNETAHRWLVGLRDLRIRWIQAALKTALAQANESRPRPSPELSAAQAALAPLTSALETLEPLTQHLDLAGLEFDHLRAAVDVLIADPARMTLPRAHQLRSAMVDAGARPVLDGLSSRLAAGQPVDATFAADRLTYVALMSTLEHLQGADPALAREPGELAGDEHTFRAADRTHITANRDRVSRAIAERTRTQLNALAEQRLAVQDQVRRKRSFKSLRQLVEEAPDALLALKPCWAMSPLLVSRYLPALPGLFDMVVFDEASQVLVPDAVPSLLRGKQAVVAGDEKQLPPTTVFTKMLDADYDPDTGTLTEWSADHEVDGDSLEEDAELTPSAAQPAKHAAPAPTPVPVVSVATGYQSILSALGSLLPSRTLLWHYRSRDERLIAVSNQEVYGGTLVTFPGPAGAEVLRHVVCPPSEGLGTHNKSPQAEVDTVCELVLEHARAQLLKPEDERASLGVIAMGRDHADRVEKAVFAALEAAPDREQLAELFDESASEPYFFKNIERVQGDERDSIIMSVGYGTSRDGRLRYMWGPLLGEYGVNRLNVAISRARAQLTLVTSFTADQLTDSGSTAPGYQLMRAFVVFVASGGTHLPSTGSPEPMNPFELEIHGRLTDAGLTLDPQYGVSGYRLDFAVRHPDFDGSAGPVRHLLAIECDGRAWHSGWTARERDRLRQQQLETVGWRFHRIWSTDWFRDPDAEVDRVLSTYAVALDRSRAGQRPAEMLPPADPRWLGAGTNSSVMATATRRRPPGWISSGAPITTYSDTQLRSLVTWLRSDGVLRLADDEIGELVAALGFQRRGPVIVARLSAAQRTCDSAPTPFR